MKKVNVWIQDLHLLCIEGDTEITCLYFKDPSDALFAMEDLLKSDDVIQHR